MSGDTTIRFDAPPKIDRVTLAVAPVDGVAGSLVRGGVTARVAGLMDRPIVNGSGLLVFINLPDQPHYDVEVDARRAGFPFVEHFAFTPPAASNKDPAARRRDVLLTPGPDYPFPPGTTLIRGVVVRGATPTAGASITAAPAADGAAFGTRSSVSGAFALALRLPPLGTHEAEALVSVSITVSDAVGARTLVRSIANGRAHSFLEPIDLAGANDPGFFAT
jgi:hypothetical protein